MNRISQASRLGLLLRTRSASAAASSGGNVYGTVADASGAGLPGANTLSGTSDDDDHGSDGAHRFLNRRGAYRVAVT